MVRPIYRHAAGLFMFSVLAISGALAQGAKDSNKQSAGL